MEGTNEERAKGLRSWGWKKGWREKPLPCKKMVRGLPPGNWRRRKEFKLHLGRLRSLLLQLPLLLGEKRQEKG